MAVMTVMLLAAAAASPTHMLVDLLEAQQAPLVLVTATNTPSFSFAAPSHAGAMTDYQVVVVDTTGKAVWDSGKTPATGAVNIVCGTALKAGAGYTWTAQYWTAAGASEKSESSFVVGLLTEADWAGASWLGGGQGQFRMSLSASMVQSAAAGGRIILHIASPGGATVSVGGAVIGDPTGVSLWADNSKSVPYISYDLSAALLTASSTEAVVTAGRGFWVGKSSGKERAARMLLTSGSGEALLRSGEGIEGRVGPVLHDDPFQGSTVDTTLPANHGWTAASPAKSGAGYTPSGKLFPLPPPYATKRGAFKAVSVEPVPGRPGVLLYTFPGNIVGHAELEAGAVSGNGSVVLEHCEVYNHTLNGCMPFGVPPAGGFKAPLPICDSKAGCDEYIINPQSSGPYSPLFTWHGFQYVMVRPSEGTKFSGAKDALTAYWTTADLSPSATIEFSGEGADVLNKLRDISAASQISNVGAFMPTDCPTREKHGWLGDAQITAEYGMYNLWSPGIYSLFLSQMRDSQALTGPTEGFVAGVVPGKTSGKLPAANGKCSGLDISWTAAYPLIAGWLVQYFGDVASAREHWASLKSYVDAQLHVANSTAVGGLPDFWTWGDWCAVQDRAHATPGTGAEAAAANFLLALTQMESAATALGEKADAERYAAAYKSLAEVFSHRFWNSTLGTWASDPLELQTLTSLALGAGVGTAEERKSALSALDADIAGRGYHLTVGSAGQKWLLRTLSKEGYHDTALKLATQTTFPSWGYWLSLGATTCWENWSGHFDGSHPPHPTHNHIFLCGGLGEWFYEYMAGIIPTSPGYGTVSVKPSISKSVGPSSVSASVTTVRGVVLSNWTRAVTLPQGSPPPPSGVELVRLHVQIPLGIRTATVHLPLLGLASNAARVTTNGVTLWDAEALSLAEGVLSCIPVVAADGDEVMQLTLTHGTFEFAAFAA